MSVDEPLPEGEDDFLAAFADSESEDDGDDAAFEALGFSSEEFASCLKVCCLSMAVHVPQPLRCQSIHLCQGLADVEARRRQGYSI